MTVLLLPYMLTALLSSFMVDARRPAAQPLLHTGSSSVFATLGSSAAFALSARCLVCSTRSQRSTRLISWPVLSSGNWLAGPNSCNPVAWPKVQCSGDNPRPQHQEYGPDCSPSTFSCKTILCGGCHRDPRGIHKDQTVLDEGGR